MMSTITTICVYPPIPCRQFDWCAFYVGEEELGEYGWGMTEQDAARDLTENYPQGDRTENDQAPAQPTWKGRA